MPLTTVDSTGRDMIYTGIGSRLTPLNVLMKMNSTAYCLAKMGWILRSGGAEGADSTFEQGCLQGCGQKEIYLPWAAFNNNKSILYPPTRLAMDIASKIHPAWSILGRGSKLLHARNVHQILGRDCLTPSDVVICWTPKGKEIGGTATAIKLARQHDIQVYNLAINDLLLDLFCIA